MNDIIEKEEIKIENLIYEIRGKQVMLSSDVAKLYKVETKRINEVIKRNINRFPESFCFQLIEDEVNDLSSRSQFATLNKSNNLRGYNIKYLPYALTEQGIMMLSGLLKSDTAVKVNIQVIEAFVKMKKYISSNLIEQRYINNQVIKNTEDIKLLQETFNKLNKNKNDNGLFFAGQIYDAYSLILDILNSAENKIVIIDNYLDKKILDILRKIDKNIIFVTNKYNNDDYDKYKLQYENITLRINNKIHDRFIILDNKVLYHCGASLKDVGKKCFAITIIKNKKWLDDLLLKI